jgi:prevent-host-death family protein
MIRGYASGSIIVDGGLTRWGQFWLHKAMKRVGVAELKNNLSRYLRAAEAGETIEVTDHARALARIVPAAGSGRRITIQPATRPLAELRARRLAPLALAVDLATILDEERADRRLPPDSR